MCSSVVFAAVFVAVTGSVDPDSSLNVNGTLATPQTFSCAFEESECFRYNRLLYKGDGKCYRIGNRGPCSWDREFVVLKEPYLKSGRFIGGCQLSHRCGDPRMVLMKDGSCQPLGNSAYRCPYNDTLHLKKNIFGESECFSADKCKKCRAKQSEEERSCAEPNLSYEVPAELQSRNRSFSLSAGRFECSTLLVTCLNNGTLPVPNDEQCAKPLESCSGGGWYVVHKEKFFENRTVSLTCQTPRCPLGWLFMAKEVYGSNGCCPLADVQKKLCAGEDILFNAFGEALCGRVASQESLLALPDVPADQCIPRDIPSLDAKLVPASAAVVVSQPIAGVDDAGKSQVESFAQEEEV